MRLQVQPYNLPFPPASYAGADANAVASWMTNRIPGTNRTYVSIPYVSKNELNLSMFHTLFLF